MLRFPFSCEHYLPSPTLELRCRAAGPRPALRQHAAAPAAAAAAGQDEGAAAAGDSDAGAAADTTFVPVNMLPWELRVRWVGRAERDAAAESEHETDDDEPAAGAAADQAAGGQAPAAGMDGQPAAEAEQQWGQFGGGADGAAAAFGQQQEQLGVAPARDDSSFVEQGGVPVDQLPLADVIARFGAQQHAQQEAAQQQQWAQPAAAAQPWGAPQQPAAAAWQQPAAAEPPVQHLAAPLLGADPVEDLPGLTSITAAQAEARAAAESDEEEYWALATAPLLRLEFQPQPTGEDERRPMLPAPDMLPGRLGLVGRVESVVKVVHRAVKHAWAGCALAVVVHLLHSLLLIITGRHICCPEPCCSNQTAVTTSHAVHRERWEDRIAWDAKQAAQKLRWVLRLVPWQGGLAAVPSRQADAARAMFGSKGSTAKRHWRCMGGQFQSSRPA